MTNHPPIETAITLLKELRDTTPITAQRKRIDAFLAMGEDCSERVRSADLESSSPARSEAETLIKGLRTEKVDPTPSEWNYAIDCAIAHIRRHYKAMGDSVRSADVNSEVGVTSPANYSETPGVIDDADAIKILSTGYINNQFENQENNIGCCVASMEAAWRALKPHLRATEPVMVDGIDAKYWHKHYMDMQAQWEKIAFKEQPSQTCPTCGTANNQYCSDSFHLSEQPVELPVVSLMEGARAMHNYAYTNDLSDRDGFIQEEYLDNAKACAQAWGLKWK